MNNPKTKNKLKTQTLLIPVLLLLFITSCGEKQEKYDACYCASVLNNNLNSDEPTLGFYEVYKAAELSEFFQLVLMDSTHFQIDSVEVRNNEYESLNEFNYKFRVNIDSDYRFPESPNLGYALAKDTARINEILAFHIDENWLSLDKIKFIWSINTTPFPDNNEEYYILHALKLDAENKPRFSNKGVASANDFIDPRDNQVSVSVLMNEKGTQEWAQMTSDNIGKFIAMVSKNKVLSVPIINSPITGGETLISGGFTKEEAKQLADLINCDVYKREIGQAAFEQEMAECLKEK